jgi:hypothetical protein
VDFSTSTLLYATSTTGTYERMMGFVNQGTPVFSLGTLSSPTSVSTIWSGTRWYIYGFTQLSPTLHIYYYQLSAFTSVRVMNPILNQIQKDLMNIFMILDNAPTV